MLDASLVDELLRRARAGDRPAMERLLAELHPDLERLAHGHADPGSPGESTVDLVQEAALRIWQRLDQFRGGPDAEQTAAMFRDWVAQLVHHLGLDRQRRQHAQRREPPGKLIRLDGGKEGASGSEGAGLDPLASGPTASANVGAEEQARLIREAVARIPQLTDREIVRLCFFEGQSLRQVAESLQLSYDKVRERYHHALRVLERELGGLL
jgi:RNA polymerase sigma factor (sigma-70 family)